MKRVRQFSRWLFCGEDCSSGVHLVVYAAPGEILTVNEDTTVGWMGTQEEFLAEFFPMEVQLP
jgi:hypothetical protein